MKTIYGELERLWESIDNGDLMSVTEAIAQTDGNIICLGAGRMGYAVQAFSMRLSHLGYSSYMIGDTTMPRVRSGDLIIINSSSGETPSIVLLAKLAKAHGGKLVVISGNKKSTLGKMADIGLYYKKIHSSQLMKTAYEQFTFLLFDHIAQRVFEVSNTDLSWVEENHSILE